MAQKIKHPHPGAMFKAKYLTQRGDIKEFAASTKISRQYWGEVFRGEKRVTGKLAICMSDISKESAEHWARLQADHDVAMARRRKSYRR